MIWDTLSVLLEKNKVLTSWGDQFPWFFLKSPDVRLFSLIPRKTTEKASDIQLSQYKPEFCRTDWRFYVILSQMFLHRVLRPSWMFSQMFRLWVQLRQILFSNNPMCCAFPIYPNTLIYFSLRMKDSQKLNKTKFNRLLRRTMKMVWASLLPNWVIVEN